MSESPVLAVKGLTKQYGRKKAVSDLNFSVEKNELVGLLGPNGAGKSTTLRMIAGSLAPSGGSVTIHGYDIIGQPQQAKQQIGYLPELPPLYLNMTVKEYLDFAGELKKNADPQWMEDLVENLELTKVMRSLTRSLSKGFRQRLGIAAALAGKPLLLLLDEPASGLDPRQTADLRSLLRQMSQSMAIVVSSHGLHDIAALCTRIIIMNEGRIAADASPQELAGTVQHQDSFEASGDMHLAGSLEQVFISLTGNGEK